MSTDLHLTTTTASPLPSVIESEPAQPLQQSEHAAAKTAVTTLASASQNPSAIRSGVDFSEDPGLVMTSCANCGAQMLDRKCKLICSCGYFLSCSDYY
jgi:hypothetical protein